MKTPFQRIIGLNLAIMLGLAVVLRLLNHGYEAGLAFVLMMALALTAHALVLLGCAIFSKSSENTRAYWLSLLLVPLIGFGTCLVGASLYH